MYVSYIYVCMYVSYISIYVCMYHIVYICIIYIYLYINECLKGLNRYINYKLTINNNVPKLFIVDKNLLQQQTGWFFKKVYSKTTIGINNC